MGGGRVNCIELNTFIHGYVALEYNKFWTNMLDQYLGITKENRSKILTWGADEFNQTIENCENRFLKPIIRTMKTLTENLVTIDSSFNQSSGI